MNALKLALAVSLLLVTSNASATLYTLVTCNYKWVPEISRNVYVGTYKSSYGNLFTAYFNRYCPPTINQ